MVMDVHTHILPGIDDGSSLVEESLAMLRREAEQGVRQVIATPHFYPQSDSPERFLERRERAWQKLQQALEMHPELPEVLVGAEVHYFPGISESGALPGLTVHGKKCILLEMPPSPWTDRMYREMEDIRVKRGILPIIAHVDRYITPWKTYGIPECLADLPVLVQANASFFLQWSTKRMALRMLKAGRIHLLGSDCHNMDTRQPNLGEAVSVIRKQLGVEAFDGIYQSEKLLLENI